MDSPIDKEVMAHYPCMMDIRSPQATVHNLSPAREWNDYSAKAEADHRIANNLGVVISLVRLQAFRMARRQESIPPEEAAALLHDVATRMETAASLHRLLSRMPQATTVDIAGFLKDLCNTLAATAPERGTVAYDDRNGRACLVRAETVLGIALIVTEAVTNAIKYAHPSGIPVAIAVRCHRVGDGAVVVEIEDDGVGLPENIDPETGGGLGFQTMRILANDLGAALAFRSSPLGLCCTVTVPDAQPGQ